MRMQGRQVAKLAAVVAAFLIIVFPASIGFAHGAAPGDHMAAAHGQLSSKLLATDPSSKGTIKLESGSEAGKTWAVFLYRGETSSGRPICLVAATSEHRRGGGKSVVMGPSSCHRSSSRGFWRLATAIRLGSARRVLAFIFSKPATRVELLRSSGKVDVRRPEPLTRRQAARIGTHNLDFLVVRDHPGDCYVSLRVFTQHDRQIGATALAPC